MTNSKKINQLILRFALFIPSIIGGAIALLFIDGLLFGAYSCALLSEKQFFCMKFPKKETWNGLWIAELCIKLIYCCINRKTTIDTTQKLSMEPRFNGKIFIRNGNSNLKHWARFNRWRDIRLLLYVEAH
jgi:hypothetical protein